MRRIIVVTMVIVGLVAACGANGAKQAETDSSGTGQPGTSITPNTPATPNPNGANKNDTVPQGGPESSLVAPPSDVGDPSGGQGTYARPDVQVSQALGSQAGGAQQTVAEGTRVWGEGDQCVWVVAQGYWVRTGVCRVIDGELTYLYVLGQGPAAWYEVAVTNSMQNGAQYVYRERTFAYWEACEFGNCTAENTQVYYNNQWYTKAQFDSMVTGLAQQLEQAKAQLQQRLQQQQQQIIQQQAPAQIQQQGGVMGPVSIDTILSLTRDDNGSKILAPNCTLGTGGC
jgi:hypothetical protein